MSLTTKYLYDEHIVMEIADSSTTVEDFFSHNNTRLLDYVNEQAPTVIHIVIDLSEMTWDFPSLIKLAKMSINMRDSGRTPKNIKQYFIGSDRWINSWRSIMQKQYNEKTYVFDSIEIALDYIRNGEAN